MIETTRLPAVFLTSIFTAWYGASTLAETPDRISEARPPAGQICPQGAFVIGFDKESNILCSDTCGNHVLDAGEDCDDGNSVNGDGCSATCGSESPTAVKNEVETVVVPSPAPPADAVPVAAQPVVSKIKPSSVVFGAREVTVTIFGSGFSNSTSVLFSGDTYTPSVNQAGTELQVTLATRELPMGRYVVTVSNGPGVEVTWKKGLVVF